MMSDSEEFDADAPVERAACSRCAEVDVMTVLVHENDRGYWLHFCAPCLRALADRVESVR